MKSKKTSWEIKDNKNAAMRAPDLIAKKKNIKKRPTMPKKYKNGKGSYFTGCGKCGYPIDQCDCGKKNIKKVKGKKYNPMVQVTFDGVVWVTVPPKTKEMRIVREDKVFDIYLY